MTDAGAKKHQGLIAKDLMKQFRGRRVVDGVSLRINPGETPARYAPGTGSGEELEIEEPEMITALDRVMKAVEHARRRPGVLRRLTLGLTLGFAVGIGALWLPGALRKQAATIIPAAQRAEIGSAMLGELTALTGPACANPTGLEALAQLRDRLFPINPVRIVVLRDLPQSTMVLPGGIVVLSDAVLVGQDDPDVAAGHALAAYQGTRVTGPLETFLDRMGFVNLVRMLATGVVPSPAVADRVERMILASAPRPSADLLRPAFDAARLEWPPYAMATNLPVGPAPPSRMPPALDDAGWQALREICKP